MENQPKDMSKLLGNIVSPLDPSKQDPKQVETQLKRLESYKASIDRAVEMISWEMLGEIPNRFGGLSLGDLDWVDKKNKKVIPACKEFIEVHANMMDSNKYGLMFVGPSGSAKTTLMYALMKSMIHEEVVFLNGMNNRHNDIYKEKIMKGEVPEIQFAKDFDRYQFVTAPELASKMRSGIGEHISSEKILDPYKKCDRLFLDDLGASSPTDYFLENLFILIDYRYSRNKATICSSNLSLEELAKQMGDRIPRRLADMCQVFELV